MHDAKATHVWYSLNMRFTAGFRNAALALQQCQFFIFPRRKCMSNGLMNQTQIHGNMKYGILLNVIAITIYLHFVALHQQISHFRKKKLFSFISEFLVSTCNTLNTHYIAHLLELETFGRAKQMNK